MEVFTLAAEVYTGSTALLGLAEDIGASGAFLGLANACPELCAPAIWPETASAQREVARLSVRQAGDFPGGLKQLTADRWQVPAFTRTPAGRPLGQAARLAQDSRRSAVAGQQPAAASCRPAGPPARRSRPARRTAA